MWGSETQKRDFGEIWPLWSGDAGRRDRREAVRRLRPLVDQAYAPAQFALGSAYFDGDGARRDAKAAFEQFSAAADQEYPAAENMVGAFHAMVKPEHGVCPHDPAEAVRWYRRGAEHGNVGAMFNLASSYRSGLGVEPDPVEVFVWASLAASLSPIRNRPAEVLRDGAAAEFDGDRLAEAERRIDEMSASLPKPWSEPGAYWKRLWQEYF